VKTGHPVRVVVLAKHIRISPDALVQHHLDGLFSRAMTAVLVE
jgi:hypothetical protein